TGRRTGTRAQWRMGGRDAKGRAFATLGRGLDRSAAPEVRHRVLTLLAGLPEGHAAADASVLARLRWERPLRGRGGAADRQDAGQRTAGAASSAAASGDGDDLRSRLARGRRAGAEVLGGPGRGARPTPGRALLGAPAAASGARDRERADAADRGPGDKLPVHHRTAPPPVPAPLSPAEQATASA